MRFRLRTLLIVLALGPAVISSGCIQAGGGGAFHDPMLLNLGAIALELSVGTGDPLRRFENVRCRYRCNGSGSYSTVVMQMKTDPAVETRILCECNIPNDFHCSDRTTSYYFEFCFDGVDKRYPSDASKVFSLALPESQTTQFSP
jgi:hypothetical protein